jgi:hypothetical protein
MILRVAIFDELFFVRGASAGAVFALSDWLSHASTIPHCNTFRVVHAALIESIAQQNLCNSPRAIATQQTTAAMAKALTLALLMAPVAALVAPPTMLRRHTLKAEDVDFLLGGDVVEDSDEPAPLTDAQEKANRNTLSFLQTRYFFGRVDVYLGPQYKPLSEVFEPSRKDDTTAMGSVVVPTPFGMVFEESANYRGKFEILEVVPDGNAAKAGIRVGDILRGTTAMALNIAQSSEEDFGFSVGLTEGTRERAFLPVDRKKFDLVMAALQSNAPDNSGPGEACLVFERVVSVVEEA